jgi:hypothetical protein
MRCNCYNGDEIFRLAAIRAAKSITFEAFLFNPMPSGAVP